MRSLSVSPHQLKYVSPSPVAGRPAVPLPTSSTEARTSSPKQRTPSSSSSQQRNLIAQQLVQQSFSNSQQSLYRALSQQGQAAAIVTQSRTEGRPLSQQGGGQQQALGQQAINQQQAIGQQTRPFSQQSQTSQHKIPSQQSLNQQQSISQQGLASQQQMLSQQVQQGGGQQQNMLRQQPTSQQQGLVQQQGIVQQNVMVQAQGIAYAGVTQRSGIGHPQQQQQPGSPQTHQFQGAPPQQPHLQQRQQGLQQQPLPGLTPQQQAALLEQQQALLAQQQPVRSQQKPVLSQQHILAQQQQQQAMLSQYQQQVASRAETGERTYMNVQPVAGRGWSMPGRRQEGDQELLDLRTTPAIPCSQEVKHKQEPLYATILQGPSQPEGGYEESSAMYANYAPASLYSNYSNYSELDVLRSSDSHCSAEEEHTEGLPSLGDSPVSSSYSELRQVSRSNLKHVTHLFTGTHTRRQPAPAAARSFWPDGSRWAVRAGDSSQRIPGSRHCRQGGRTLQDSLQQLRF